MFEAMLMTSRPGSGVVTGDTKLLMHMDGVDSTTVFVEEKGRTVTQTGGQAGPVIATARKRFGSASCRCPGAGRLSVSEDAALRLNGDYTVEFWVYIATAEYNQNCAVMGKGASFLQYFNGTFYLRDDGAYRASATIPSTDAWHHVAFTKDATGLTRLFYDGALYNSVSGGTTFGTAAGTPFVVGSSDAFDTPFKCWMDDVRVSATCLYSANFTPPTGPFPG